MGKMRAHHALSWAIREMHGRKMDVWDEARAELAQSEAPINIISSEALWFTDPAAVKEQVKDQTDLRIVVYLRRQDQYLQSLYKQAVTSGRKDDFLSWRAQTGDRGDYLSVLRGWAGAFGRENLILRAYERDDARVDVTQDFFEAIGVDVAAEIADRDTRQRRHNPSPRHELLSLIRAANKTPYRFEHDKFFWSVIRHKGAYVGSSDLLDYDDCVELMRGYERINRGLSEEFFGGRDIFPPVRRTEAPPTWSVDDEEYVSMTAHFLEKLLDLAMSGEIKRKPRAAKARQDAAKEE
jgi:hypothetical protein